jgi:DNA-binding NtrC family response regulator
MVEHDTFREDLYFRLKVFPVTIPPLKDRKEDIPALVRHILQKKSREMTLGTVPVLEPGAMDQLMAYAWPGNVRELENALERALILYGKRPLAFHDLAGENSSAPDEGTVKPALEPLDSVIARHIRYVLKSTHGRVEGEHGAARILEVNPGTLRHRMRKLGIKFGRKKK